MLLQADPRKRCQRVGHPSTEIVPSPVIVRFPRTALLRINASPGLNSLARLQSGPRHCKRSKHFPKGNAAPQRQLCSHMS